MPVCQQRLSWRRCHLQALSVLGQTPSSWEPVRDQIANESKGKQATKPIRLEDPFEAEERIRPTAKAIVPGANIESQQKAESKERDIPASSTRTNAKIAQLVQPQVRKDPGTAADLESKFPLPPTTNYSQSQPARPRPVKPTREPPQKQKPQPVSIRLGTRMPMPSVAPNTQESSAAPASVPTKQSTLTKKPSNSSLHTASSNTSLKSSTSTQSQRGAEETCCLTQATARRRSATSGTGALCCRGE